MLNAAVGGDAENSMDTEGSSADRPSGSSREDAHDGGKQKTRSPLRIDPGRPSTSDTLSSDDNQSPARRQRRRLGDHEFSPDGVAYPTSTNASAASLVLGPNATRRRGRGYSHTYSSLSPVNPLVGDRRSSSVDTISSDSEDELAGAVGQLSLNEDEQVRYHGKASGLHILNDKVHVEGRNEGGIWFVDFSVLLVWSRR